MARRMTLFITPDSAMSEDAIPRLAEPLAVVCHDAGAANMVFAWLRSMAAAGADPSQWRLFLEGPSLRLWQHAPVTGARLVVSMAQALEGARTVLSGTGWASHLEHTARVHAAQRGIHSIATIDHWVNYNARFERDGEICLPDEAWVGDEFALAEARLTLPSVKVSQWPNLYLAECVAAIPPLTNQRELLYVLEPVRAEWAGPEGGEFSALEFFARHFRRVIDDETRAVCLRPHPSDAPGKYDAWISAHPELDARLDDSPTLAEALGKARIVCGAETFAMVVALAAGRRVWSTLPPHGHRCRLPQPGITHLRDLCGAES